MFNRLMAAAVLILAHSVAYCTPSAPDVVKMGNGLTVIMHEDHAAPLVGVDVWVRAGSASETSATNGVSHLIEHLVFASTNKRQPGDMDREIESIGATLDARTSRDWAHFGTTTASQFLPKALDILADAVTSSLFREEDLERERPIILEEITKKETEPLRLCKDYLSAELYGNHPYGLPIEGTRGSITAITREIILQHYKKHYVPRNMAVVLVGDIDKQAAVAAVGKAFQGLPEMPASAAESTPGASVPPPAQQVKKSIKAPFKLNYVAIGFLGPAAAAQEDVCAVDLLLGYIGFGYRSWMTEELVRGKAIAIEAESDFLTQKEPSLISIIASATQSNLDPVQVTIMAKIGTIRAEGIPAGSLATAKRSLLGQYAFQNETYGGFANSIGFYYTVSDPAFATNYVECVQAVSNEDIIRVAQKYLDPAKAIILTIGPDQEAAK